MAELKIELLGSPVLRQRAAEIDRAEIDESLRSLIADMMETMYAAEGIGLAAPQIGISKRLVVIDLKQPEHEPLVLVNPRIVESGSEQEKAEEGCLSLPGVSALVQRPARVVVEAIDEQGRDFRIEADDLLARCIQHEIDHLDGTLFIDHLSALKRSMLLKKYRTLRAEAMAEEAEQNSIQERG